MATAKRVAAGDRLYPALLDRLIDEEPTRRSESDSNKAMSRTQYRQAVLRDLRWLFNAINSASEIDYQGFEQAERSVINFGLPALAGQRLSELEWPKIEEYIKEAIKAFEPRILENTIQVTAIRSVDALSHHNLLAFEIKGLLWSEPYPLELLLRSQIDLESGTVSVIDNASAVS
jgi:type VI secretion system protein ImpF